MHQLVSLCEGAGIEVLDSLPVRGGFERVVSRRLSDSDVMIINGEGTLHHDAPPALSIMRAGLLAHRRGIPVALVNTVWEGNSKTNALLAHCCWISARESMSAQEIGATGADVLVLPDLTLTADASKIFGPSNSSTGEGVVVLDDQRWEVRLTLARYAAARGFRFLPMGGRPSLRKFDGWKRMIALWAGSDASQMDEKALPDLQSAETVVTGRFHGVCLAILAGRPFLAFRSNTHKVEGLLRDANLGPCARLLPDPMPGPDGFAAIDQALSELRLFTADPNHLDAYRRACTKLVTRTREDARHFFAQIAHGLEQSVGERLHSPSCP